MAATLRYIDADIVTRGRDLVRGHYIRNGHDAFIQGDVAFRNHPSPDNPSLAVRESHHSSERHHTASPICQTRMPKANHDTGGE